MKINIENHQSREEIAELGITPDSVAQMLQTDCSGLLRLTVNRLAFQLPTPA